MPVNATAKRKRNPAPQGDLAIQVGALVRAAREKRGISQTAAGQPHVTRAMLSAIEKATVLPSLKTLAFLSDRFQVPLRSLIPDIQPKSERERRTR